MQKTKRLLAIEKIISEGSISTQEELMKRLKVKGFNCTQATLSRNLRQLGIVRIPDGKTGYHYALPESTRQPVQIDVRQNIIPSVTGIVEGRDLMVLRTLPGNANHVAVYIDSSSRFEIAGTIAGDDTILVIPRNGITLHQVHTCLELILPGLHEKVKQI